MFKLLTTLFPLVFVFLFCSNGYAQDYPKTEIKGFVDVTTHIEKDKVYQSLGQYDLYVTSQINDRISFLGETVFEFDSGFIIDVERIVIKYEINNALNFLLGKHHTPIGYWNTEYHHGSVLQPTISRPNMFVFEDEGGVLPIHTVGLLLSGDYIGNTNFGYDFLIGNGIGSNVIEDNDKYKSLTLGMHIEPISDLKINVSAYFDRLSEGINNLQGGVLSEEIDKKLFTASVIYLPLTANFEFMVEYMTGGNKSELAGNKNVTAAYAYLGYKVQKFAFYYRFDYMTFDEGDIYYLKNDLNNHLLGARYNFNHTSNIKFEIQRVDSELFGVSTEGIIQFGIGF